MRKKIILTLSCIAAVAIATFVCKKIYESNVQQCSLLMYNVEALSQESGENGKGCKLHLTSICETEHKDHYLYRNR